MAPLLEFLGYEDHGVQWELFHDGYEFFFVQMAEEPAGVFGGQGADSGEEVSQGAGRFVAYGIFWESGDVHVVFIGNGVKEISGEVVLSHSVSHVYIAKLDESA